MRRLFRNSSLKKRGVESTSSTATTTTTTDSRDLTTSTHSTRPFNSPPLIPIHSIYPLQSSPHSSTTNLAPPPNSTSFSSLPTSPSHSPPSLPTSEPTTPAPPITTTTGWKLFGGGKQNGVTKNGNNSPPLQPVPPQPDQQQQPQFSPQRIFVPSPLPTQVIMPMGPPRVDNIAGVIGWSCSHDPLDYAYVLAFCDYVAVSSFASKEAAKLLRKELKYGLPEAQERALKLMGIMMRNTDTRFRQQIASKKFLSELSDLISSKKTSPLVRETALRVLSPMAYDSQRDSDLSPITTLFNKLKPPTAPINGVPLAADDTLFQPAPSARKHRSPQQPPQRMPSTSETLFALRREALDAKGFAAVLMETLTFTTAEDLGSNEIVAEFHAKCLGAQASLGSHLDWVSVQAERARVLQPPSVPLQTRPNGNGDGHGELGEEKSLVIPEGEKETEEEFTLAILLGANSELAEALAFHSARFAAAREAAELDLVAERSKNETRFDRARAGLPDQNGDYTSPEELERQNQRRSRTHDYQEGPSRDPSPIRDKGKGKAREIGDKNPYAMFLSPSAPANSTPLPAPAPTELVGYEVPGSTRIYDEPETLREDEDSFDSVPLFRRTPTGESEILTPMAPSEKALGKLRRVSIRPGELDPVQQQHQMEQELRDRYARNYDDERVRKSQEYQRDALDLR